MEKRTGIKRLKKRLTVRFGQGTADKVAFTEDMSPAGIFLKTAQIIQPGRPVNVLFELDQETVHLEGMVAWAKKVPPTMLRVARKCGMGIRINRFLSGKEAYEALFREV